MCILLSELCCVLCIKLLLVTSTCRSTSGDEITWHSFCACEHHGARKRFQRALDLEVDKASMSLTQRKYEFEKWICADRPYGIGPWGLFHRMWLRQLASVSSHSFLHRVHGHLHPHARPLYRACHDVWRGLGNNLDVVCASMSTGGVLRRSQNKRTRQSSPSTDQETVAAGLIFCAPSHTTIHCAWKSSDSEVESNHKDLIM